MSERPTPDRNSEALVALHDFMTLRRELGEMESAAEASCSCDPNNFHRCQACDDVAKLDVEYRRQLDLWAERWICMLAQKVLPCEATSKGSDR